MAEAVEITRSERPVNFRQKSTISADNLERNFRHADDEINKIYQILGEEGIINRASIRTVIIGSGGIGGGAIAPLDGKYILIEIDPDFPDARGLVSNQGIKQVDGGSGGNLVLSADINALTEKTEPTNVDFAMIYDATGLNNKKVTIDKLGSEYWQDPVIDTLTTPPI